MSNFAKNMNGSSAELKVGAGITGILVKQKEPEDVAEVSFAYTKPNQSINVGVVFLFWPKPDLKQALYWQSGYC